MGIPVILYVIVCPLWKIRRYCSPSAPVINSSLSKSNQTHPKKFFFYTKFPTFYIQIKIQTLNYQELNIFGTCYPKGLGGGLSFSLHDR